jgi:hypothetical protein
VLYTLIAQNPKTDGGVICEDWKTAREAIEHATTLIDQGYDVIVTDTFGKVHTRDRFDDLLATGAATDIPSH